MPEIGFSRNCFPKENSWTESRVHGLRGPGPRGPATETSAQKDDGEGAVRTRRGGVGGVGGFTVGGVGFYRAEARWGRAERRQLPA
jgi:hypothetical protein